MSVIDEIAAERQRQIGKEGFAPTHDDGHADASLAMAAACYAAPHRIYIRADYADGVRFLDPWPWEPYADKRPHNGNVVRGNCTEGEAKRRELLVKAGALIVAEVERIDRATLSEDGRNNG